MVRTGRLLCDELQWGPETLVSWCGVQALAYNLYPCTNCNLQGRRRTPVPPAPRKYNKHSKTEGTLLVELQLQQLVMAVFLVLALARLVGHVTGEPWVGQVRGLG